MSSEMEVDDGGGNYELPNSLPATVTTAHMESNDPLDADEHSRELRLPPENPVQFFTDVNPPKEGLPTRIVWFSEFDNPVNADTALSAFHSVASSIQVYAEEVEAMHPASYDNLSDSVAANKAFRATVAIPNELLEKSSSVNLHKVLDLLQGDTKDLFLMNLPDGNHLKETHLRRDDYDMWGNSILSAKICISDLVAADPRVTHGSFDAVYSTQTSTHYAISIAPGSRLSLPEIYQLIKEGRFLLVEFHNRVTLVKIDETLATNLIKAITAQFMSIINDLHGSYIRLPLYDQPLAPSANSAAPRAAAAQPSRNIPQFSDYLCSNGTVRCTHVFISGIPEVLSHTKDPVKLREFLAVIANKLSISIKIPHAFSVKQMGNFPGTWGHLFELDRPNLFAIYAGVQGQQKIRQKVAYTHVKVPIANAPRALISSMAYTEEELAIWKDHRPIFHVRHISTMDSTSMAVQRELIQEHAQGILPKNKALIVPFVVKQARFNPIRNKEGKVMWASHDETVLAVLVQCDNAQVDALQCKFDLIPPTINPASDYRYEQHVRLVHSTRFVFVISPAFVPNMEIPKAAYLPVHTSSFSIPELKLADLPEAMNILREDSAARDIDFVFPILESSVGLHIRGKDNVAQPGLNNQLVVVWKNLSRDFSSLTHDAFGRHPKSYPSFPGLLHEQFTSHSSVPEDQGPNAFNQALAPRATTWQPSRQMQPASVAVNRVMQRKNAAPGPTTHRAGPSSSQPMASNSRTTAPQPRQLAGAWRNGSPNIGGLQATRSSAADVRNYPSLSLIHI